MWRRPTLYITVIFVCPQLSSQAQLTPSIMLIRSDPDTFGRAMLVFAEQSMTSNTLYIPLKDTSRDVAYVVSEENDDSNHVVVRRGPPDEKFVVADIRYNPKSTKEVGTIDFMDLKGGPISFRNWLTRGGKAGAEQKLSIDGEDHSWTQQKEGKRDSDITYSVREHVVLHRLTLLNG